jgi:hypothetical protein
VEDTCVSLPIDATRYYRGAWGKGNSAIATSSYDSIGMGPGSTNNFAHGTGPIGGGLQSRSCPVRAVTAQGTTNVQVPTSLKVISVSILQQGQPPDHGCLPGFYGIALDIKYQVLDGETPPQPINNPTMTPTEHVVFSDGSTHDGNVGPAPNYSDSTLTTAADGSFHDVPVETCKAVPFTTALKISQDISIKLSNGASYRVRHNDFQMSSTNLPNQGTITNGGDINKSQ